MSARRVIVGGVALLLVCTLLGCGGSPFKTKDARDEVRAEYGLPEEVNTYSSEGYWSETWWYWSRGISFTFVSDGGDVELQSTYTFSPIR